MAKTIPLIRAAAIVPMLSWLRAQGRSVEQSLAAVDLDYLNPDTPMQVVPVHNAAALFRRLCAEEGPDIGCRVVTQSSVPELALLGKVILGARTPREALTRIIATLPYHCSHEHMQLLTLGDGVAFTDGWSVDLDPQTRHVLQQYVAELIATICRKGEAHQIVLDRVELTPHPQAGLAHLTPWFGDRMVAARTKALTVHISAEVADQPMRFGARDRSAQLLAAGLQPLNGYDRLADSAQVVIAAMLETGTPNVERLAVAAGLSLRTLQRRLKAEGTSFSELLEAERRKLVLAGLTQDAGLLSMVSASAGYARQSTLTRAVRRWTGRAPSALRKTGDV